MFPELYKYLRNPSHCNQYLLMAVPEGVQLDSLKKMYNCDNTTAEPCRSCDFVTDMCQLPFNCQSANILITQVYVARMSLDIQFPISSH